MRKGKKGKGKGSIGNGEKLPLTTNNKNNNSFAYYDPIICCEGIHLLHLFQSLHRNINSATTMDGALPLKFWLKQNFSIGVNEVTRVLELMPSADVCSHSGNPIPHNESRPPIQLQAILLASDSFPRSLIRHLPSLASSRKVPLIFVKDKKGGSLKLGELVKLKTCIAIGVKANQNSINQLMEGIISGNAVYNDGVET